MELHKTYTPNILAAMNKAVLDGTPVNPPIWWIAPTDEVALSVGDRKQFNAIKCSFLTRLTF